MRKCFLLIVLFLGGLLSACSGKQEPAVKTSSEEPAWIKDLVWDEISDRDFVLSADGMTLLKWLNEGVVNLDMNRNPRLKQVKVIEKEVFKGCDHLTALKLSDQVHTLSVECFDGPDNLEYIYLAKVRTIEEEAFKGQEKLKELHFPETLVHLDEAFHAVCDSFKTLTVAPNNPKYKMVDNVLFTRDQQTLISYPPNYNGGDTYVIPDGVVRLGKIAFEDCRHLKEITCPPSLVEIGYESFYTEVYGEHHYNVIRLLAKQVVRVNLYPSPDRDPHQLKIDGRTRVLVPKELVEQYKADPVWRKIADQIEALR